MFGMGGSEIVVILIVALLFLGPDKLPQAAKQISKGIRDIKKQSRALQQQIEDDEQIGGAIRDLKSALRGEEAPALPKKKKKKKLLVEGVGTIGGTAVVEGDKQIEGEEAKALAEAATQPALEVASGEPPAAEEPAANGAHPKITLPPVAGEADPDAPVSHDDDDLAAMIKPAAGTVAKGSTDHG